MTAVVFPPMGTYVFDWLSQAIPNRDPTGSENPVVLKPRASTYFSVGPGRARLLGAPHAHPQMGDRPLAQLVRALHAHNVVSRL